MAEPSSYFSEKLHHYIWRDAGGHGPINLSVPSATHLPIIDFNLLLRSSSSTMDTHPELLNLRSALSLGVASRDVFSKYMDRLVGIKIELLKSMAKSLSLSDNCFVKQFGEQPTTDARFNIYPPCSMPGQVIGLKPHADGSGITMILQDKYLEGLQLLKDGQWFRVPTLSNALLVNVGDQVEIMSNGIFKSPVHRAVTNSERERNTLAVFYSPDPRQEIEPVEELVDETRPRMFKNVQDYMKPYFHYYQQGKRPIDAVRI